MRGVVSVRKRTRTRTPQATRMVNRSCFRTVPAPDNAGQSTAAGTGWQEAGTCRLGRIICPVSCTPLEARAGESRPGFKQREAALAASWASASPRNHARAMPPAHSAAPPLSPHRSPPSTCPPTPLPLAPKAPSRRCRCSSPSAEHRDERAHLQHAAPQRPHVRLPPVLLLRPRQAQTARGASDPSGVREAICRENWFVRVLACRCCCVTPKHRSSPISSPGKYMSLLCLSLSPCLPLCPISQPHCFAC